MGDCRKIQHLRGETRQSGEDGQALVEFAFAFPLQLLIIFAIVQLSLIFVARQVVSYAAFAGARAAMVAEDAEEAALRASRSAALVCSPITGLTIGGSNVSWSEATSSEAVIDIPGWGRVPKSGVSARLKTFTHEPDFSQVGEVHVTVTHYYELVFPVVSKVFAWAARSGSEEGFLHSREQISSGVGELGSTVQGTEAGWEASTGIWNIRGADHIRLRATAKLVIPGTEEERLRAAGAM
jgi:Flp pilus assembly protein TadG